MISYTYSNVNQYYPVMINDMKQLGVPRKSRNGPVLERDAPVAVTYTRPMERVLFNKDRMCNHFFHFVEGLWLISGARDVDTLDRFNSTIKAYSDDKSTFWGAYGYRLRHAAGFDQIERAVGLLKKNHDDRRVVITMWDAKSDLGGQRLDHPCNTAIYLKIRNERLQMTILCRSNDAIWGQTGANVVHFSMLGEYLAARVGVPLGQMHTLSDSLHVYTELPIWTAVKNTSYCPVDHYDYAEHLDDAVTPYPMLKGGDIEGWHKDLEDFMEDPMRISEYRTPFFQEVAQPIALVWNQHKTKRNGMNYVSSIKATDWQLGCRTWLQAKEQPK